MRSVTRTAVQAADAADGSEGQSLASSTRRTSRAFSDTGSEGGLSDGGQSYVSGDGSKSGVTCQFQGSSTVMVGDIVERTLNSVRPSC